MSKKQNITFTLVFSLFVSIVLTFFMTAILNGFNEMFVSEYIFGVLVAIVVSTPLSYVASPILARNIFTGEAPTKVQEVIFNLALGLIIAGGVTFFIILIKAGMTSQFLVHWMPVWGLAFIIAYILIQIFAGAFQSLAKKLVD